MNENKIKILFGRKVKYLRNNLNLTQFSLGEKANINQRQVALIEAGKSFPSLKTLVCFAQIFSCELKDLFVFDNLQDSEILKKEMNILLENLSDEKMKTIYTITKSLI